ncbi:MAG: IS110 family transposase [Anaerolineales bacterium]
MIAVDLAKSVFEVSVSREPGRVCQRKRLSRTQFARFLREQPPATLLMEACGTAHYWARLAQEAGHRALLLPVQHVCPYRLRDKTDHADTRALLEAFRNEKISPVPVKTPFQQAIAGLHRIRSGWLSTRTARLNTVRGLLRELGIVIPEGSRLVLPRLCQALADANTPIPEALHPVLLSAASEIRQLEASIKDVEGQLKELSKSLPACPSLRSVPGIGLLTSTALIASVGDPSRFRNGRRLASSLGVVPKEHSSGSSRHLGSITKRGDPYLRTLLTHGARSVLWAARHAKNPDPLQRWALSVQARRGHNRAAIAPANKLARIAWAVWSKNTVYQSSSAEALS